MIWKFILNSLPPMSPSNFIQISLAVVPDQSARSVHNIRGRFGLWLSISGSLLVILQQLKNLVDHVRNEHMKSVALSTTR